MSATAFQQFISRGKASRKSRARFESINLETADRFHTAGSDRHHRIACCLCRPQISFTFRQVGSHVGQSADQRELTIR